MDANIQKALDLNKLFQEHNKGKLLKKILKFPVLVPIKFDGNYVVVLVERGKPRFITSGGLEYTHLDGGGDIFNDLPDRAFLAERIWGKGVLGDRNRCNLKGPKDAQTSKGHSYKVFDMLTLEEYYDGQSHIRYSVRAEAVQAYFNGDHLAGKGLLIHTQEELDAYLKKVVNKGFEGVMCIQPDWKWKATKNRNMNFIKYKKRPTVDLLCIGATEGEGKYTGVIGSLRLQDSEGRTVDVGSGMSDEDRMQHPDFFVGKVVEMFYEQIVNTYIQPTFGSEYEGVLIRTEKTAEDID